MKEKDALYEETIDAQCDIVLRYVGKRIIEKKSLEYDRIEEESKDFKISDALSDRILRAMKEEARAQRRARNRSTINRLAKVCVIAFLLFFVTGVVLVNNVDAVKVRFDSFISEFRGDHIRLVPGENIQNILAVTPKEWNDIWYPEYIPEGYVFEEAFEIAGVMRIFKFKGGENLYIEFSQMPADGIAINVDSDDGQNQIKLKNQYPGYWTTYNGEIIMGWLQSDKIMQITATLDFDEVIKIVENLIYIRE